MKQTFKLIISMLALLVYLSILACGGGGSDGGSGGGPGCTGELPVTYATTDLQGTWSHLFKGSTTDGYLNLINGNVDGVDGGEFWETDPILSAGDYSGGSISNIPNGNISGSLETDTPSGSPPLRGGSGPTHTLISGQMSRDKGLFTSAGTKPTGEMGLFIKSGAGFTQNDLTGTWSFGNQNEYGTFTVDGAGDVTGTYNLVGSAGPPIVFPGVGDQAALLIDGTGLISGTFDTTANWNVINSGQMSSDKNVLFISLYDDAGPPGRNDYVAVRTNASFGPCDLATSTFGLVSFGDALPVGYGSFTINTSGDVTTGTTLTRIGAASEDYTGGDVEINPDGSITPFGTITTTVRTYELWWGQVSASKNFSFVVARVIAGPLAGSSEVILLVRQ